MPIVYDMPEAEYRALDAANASTLKKFRRSALHAYHALTEPSLPTRAQAMGSAIHLAVLEPERFAKDVHIGPSNDRRTKAWQQWEALVHSGLRITPEEALTVNQVREAFQKKLSGTALQLLVGKGVNEATALWTDEETGLACKARADRLTRYKTEPVIVELKTARDASLRAFSYAVRDFGYDFSAAYYLNGFAQVLPPDKTPMRVLFVVVETEAPFAIAVYELNPHVLERAALECQEFLARYKVCLETGVWAGYSDSIVEIRL